MKTTVEISDPLLRAAKAAARAEKRTLRAVLEEALRAHLDGRRRAKRKAFKLRDASVGGHGLSPEFENAPWSKFLEAAYEDRGS
jgi:predicted transcriptional regulator